MHMQEAEAEGQRIQARMEELKDLEHRLGNIQQRIDGDAQKLKKTMQAVEEERTELKVMYSAYSYLSDVSHFLHLLHQLFPLSSIFVHDQTLFLPTFVLSAAIAA